VVVPSRTPEYRRLLYRNKHPDVGYGQNIVPRRINGVSNPEYARERYHRVRGKIADGRMIRRIEIRDELITKLGGVCVRCGFSDRRALQIDHIDGGGVADFKKRGSSVYISALRNSEGFQLLCANCNWIKRYIEHE